MLMQAKNRMRLVKFYLNKGKIEEKNLLLCFKLKKLKN